LNVGGVYDHFNEMTQGIDDDMALAPFDFLASIVADFATDFSRLDTLAIDDSRTRFGLRACRSALLATGSVPDHQVPLSRHLA
jgi:hypothetical protein